MPLVNGFVEPYAEDSNARFDAAEAERRPARPRQPRPCASELAGSLMSVHVPYIRAAPHQWGYGRFVLDVTFNNL